MKRKIILTGGGSAGHITVNLALIPLLLKSGWEIFYIGSIDGIERELTAILILKRKKKMFSTLSREQSQKGLILALEPFTIKK